MRNTALKSGSALILTIFIMSGMLIVAMSGAYVVWLGIKSGGVQAQSTKAYYAAESGAEYLMYELNHDDYDHNDLTIGEFSIFSSSLPSGSSYKVYYLSSDSPLIFQSVGNYQNTRRSLEIRLGN